MTCIQLSNGAVMRVHDLPGAGVPLVFLHGLGCASSSDYPAVVHCAPLAGSRAILLDLLGFGFSDRPEAPGYTVEAHADTVVELADRLDLDPFDLYGHSMGGSIAIVTAARLGDRVRSLVVSEPNLDPGGGPFSRAIAAFSEDEYVRTGHDRVLQEAAAGGNHEWAGSMRVASALAVHRGAVSLVRGSTPSWREQLVARRERRVVLFGERSLPDADYDRLAKDGVPVAIVPGAGHSMAWENPAGLADAIAAIVGSGGRHVTERNLS
jgi:pimeloyl-ACP methyl ester carboxylesterase